MLLAHSSQCLRGRSTNRVQYSGWNKEKRENLTVLYVKRIGGQSQRGAAVVTLEAAAMEELALGT